MTGSQSDDKWLSLDLVRTVGPDVSDKDWSVLVKYRFIIVIKAENTACFRHPYGSRVPACRGKGIGSSEFCSTLLSDSMT